MAPCLRFALAAAPAAVSDLRRAGGAGPLPRGHQDLSLAVDYVDNRRHATRWQGPAPDELSAVNSHLWPGADLTDLGVAPHGDRDLLGGSVTAGLRYDHVEAGFGKADHDPASPMLLAPNALYPAYYGRAAGDENEDHLSALLRYERPVGATAVRFFAGLSRTLRTADATERYLAMNRPTNPAMRRADRQSRADDDPRTGSGLDARATAGHGVFDLFLSACAGRLGELGLGVDDLSDKTWADYLNRANQDPFNPDPVQVNEPGRTLWADWRQSFRPTAGVGRRAGRPSRPGGDGAADPRPGSVL